MAYGLVSDEVMAQIEADTKRYYQELRRAGVPSGEAHVMAQRHRAEILNQAEGRAQLEYQESQKPSDSKALLTGLGTATAAGAGAAIGTNLFGGKGSGPSWISQAYDYLTGPSAVDAPASVAAPPAVMAPAVEPATAASPLPPKTIPDAYAVEDGITAASGGPYGSEFVGLETGTPLLDVAPYPGASIDGPLADAGEWATSWDLPDTFTAPTEAASEGGGFLGTGMPGFSIGEPSGAGVIGGVVEGAQGLMALNAKDRGAAAHHLAMIAPDIYLAGLPSLAYALLGKWGPAKKVMDTVLMPLSKPLEWGMEGMGIANKSTKQYQAERWGGLGEDSKYQDLMQQSYLANHPENDTGIYQDGPFAGKRWDEVSRDELIANDPLSGNLWLGNLETFGDVWHETPLDKRAEIIKRIQAENLYADDKGDVLIFSENQPRAKQIYDEVMSGTTEPQPPALPEESGGTSRPGGGLPLDPESPLMRSALLDLIPEWQEGLNPSWQDYSSGAPLGQSALTQALMSTPDPSRPASIDLSKMQYQRPTQPAGGGFYYR